MFESPLEEIIDKIITKTTLYPNIEKYIEIA